MRSTVVFVLDKSAYNRRLNQGRGGMRCWDSRCNKELKIGDKVVSKRVPSRRGDYRKYYHYECAELLNIV